GVRALEKKGALHRRVTDKRVSRTLVLADQAPGRRAAAREIPVLGRIAAGTPLFAEENREDSIPVRPEWFARKGEDLFALRVRGESMIGAHIMDGDLVLVRRQESAQAGAGVAGLVDNEPPVKRLARRAGA